MSGKKSNIVTRYVSVVDDYPCEHSHKTNEAAVRCMEKRATAEEKRAGYPHSFTKPVSVAL